jgi:hypothetical protein
MILLNVMNQKPGKFLGTVVQGGNNKKRKEKKIYYCEFLWGGVWGDGRYVSAYS